MSADDEDLREKQFLWTARAFAIFCAVTLFCNVVVLVAVLNVFPLEKYTPYFVTFNDRDDQVVTIVSQSARQLARDDKLVESLVRQYLLLRNVVLSDADEMESRWGIDGPIKWMSDEGIYGEFSRAVVRDTLWRVKNDGLTRDVQIVSVMRSTQDVWQAEIETRDMLPDTLDPAMARWTVTMRVAFRPQTRLKYAERLKNPLGFVVMQYSVKRVS